MTCPKCAGLVVDDFGDIKCLLCGLRFHTPDAPPIVVEEARRWLSVLCAKCHTNSAVRGHTLCRPCWNKPGPKGLDTTPGKGV